MPGPVTAMLCRLVEIDSVNPSLVAGGAGETEVVAWITEWARGAGLELQRLEGTPGRPTLLVRARGTGGGRTLLLCAHTDTVGVDDMPGAHTPRIDGDRLHGRGAYDMKAGLAAALIACQETAGLGLAGDVVLAAVADEEHTSLGVQEALRVVRADAAIVTEPTELAVAIAHKGFAWATVQITGRAAHGSRPHLGIDAIVKAGPVLTALGELDARLAATTHPLLGRASVHASAIHGGGELSSYPASCTIAVERRTLPGEGAEQFATELGALLASCRAEDAELVVDHELGLVREPFETDAAVPVVLAVTAAATDALGCAPEVGGVSYWADSALIAATGVPTVLFGPSGAGAHSPQEWVSLSSAEATVRTLIGAARRLCA